MELLTFHESFDGPQAHVDAELKELVLRIRCQVIGKSDDGRVLVDWERFELPTHLRKDLPAARTGNGCRITGEAPFVRRKFRHEVIEMIRGAGGVLLLEASGTQDPQESLDVTEAAWPCRRRAGKDAGRVTMGEQPAAHIPCALAELIAPVPRGRW